MMKYYMKQIANLFYDLEDYEIRTKNNWKYLYEN